MTRISVRRAALAFAGILAIPGAGVAQQARPAALQLTLADAVERAIAHNPDLAIVRLGTEAGDARVAESRAAFTPLFETTAGRSRTGTPPSSALQGDTGLDVNDWFSSTGVTQRAPWGGGTWRVSWDAARTTTNSPFSRFDPNLQSGVQLAFSQPLLRDRAIDAARRQYAVAKRDRDSDDQRFHESLVQTVAAVKRAYWTLEAAVANVGVQQRSLDLAQELARQNEVRVDAGQIPPLDLVQAKAEVAQRRQNLIDARATAGDAEDRLRRLIADPADATFWSVPIGPIDAPPDPGAAPDVEAAVANALGGRSDLARAANDLQNAETEIKYLGNQRLPDVRVEASYRGNGLGGTQLLRTGDFPGVVTGTADESFAHALGQAFGTDYPTWSLGVTVSYPIGRSFEDASLARAEVERRQTAQRIASLRLDTAETVRRAARQVTSSAERVDAARASATLAERRLADEQRRYEVGLSTTFLVTQAQRDLLQAQVSLLQTTLDYQSATVTFEAVQQAPEAAGGATPTVRGADLVFVPPSTPQGLFRPGAGQ
jgi:outer membrane protein TolC